MSVRHVSWPRNCGVFRGEQSPGMAALGAVSLPATAGRLQILTLQINLAL
jgi:hypothetical protein